MGARGAQAVRFVDVVLAGVADGSPGTSFA